MADISELTDEIVRFRDERDWKQFHNAKDMILSLMLEAAELAELVQWKNEAELKEVLLQKKEELSDELSDILYWVLLLSHDLDIDISEAFKRKMKKNRTKYPSDLAKGRNQKYHEL